MLTKNYFRFSHFTFDFVVEKNCVAWFFCFWLTENYFVIGFLGYSLLQ